MNPKPISEAKDSDARGALAALRRAALNAHKLAEQFHTPLVIRQLETPPPVKNPSRIPLARGKKETSPPLNPLACP